MQQRHGGKVRVAVIFGGQSGEHDVSLRSAQTVMGALDPERYPNALERAWRALDCPNAGEVLVSAAEGHEFADLGGSHHAGGGSHGSLLAGDSTVPVIAVGLGDNALGAEPSVTDIAPAVLAHFGVEAPPSMRAVPHG